LKQLGKHLTFANVVSCLALFMAMSGAAYAAKTLVKTQNLVNGAVTTPKLRNGAVTTKKLRNGAVTGQKIAPATIGSGQLANGSVRSGQLGGQVVTEPKIKNGAVSESKLGAEAVSTGKLKKEAVTASTLSANFYGQLLKNVSYATKTSASDEVSPKAITAECPTGKEVVGGGARSVLGTSTESSLIESTPFVDGSGKRTGWTAKAAGSAGTFAVEAVAICAEL
jgi:trimeric autotransporter adhesin